MNIIDIENVGDINESNLGKNEKRLQLKNLVDGMSPDAHMVFKGTSNEMTREEIGVSDKKIIIPSFKTTSKLFAQHFQILRDLRHRIDLLK